MIDRSTCYSYANSIFVIVIPYFCNSIHSICFKYSTGLQINYKYINTSFKLFWNGV